MYTKQKKSTHLQLLLLKLTGTIVSYPYQAGKHLSIPLLACALPEFDLSILFCFVCLPLDVFMLQYKLNLVY